MFTNAVALIAVICICYIIGLGVYRLWLSPIASFPGPKLAALTGWYEFYYDVIFNGSYLYKIEEMHRQFGEELTPGSQHRDDYMTQIHDPSKPDRPYQSC